MNFLILDIPRKKKKKEESAIDLLNIIMPVAWENIAYKAFFCKFYFLIGNTWKFWRITQKVESGYLSKPGLQVLNISVTFTNYH